MSATTPPASQEAEKRVLGAAFWDADAINTIVEKLKADDFYWDAHRAVFSAMAAIHGRRGQVDLNSVQDELERTGSMDVVGGLTALAGISEFGIDHGSIDTNVAIVARKASHRRLIRAASQIAQLAASDGDDDRASFAQAQKILLDADRGGDDDRDYSMARMTDDFYEAYGRAVETRGEATKGISTGMNPVDELLLGLRPGELIVIGGRASMGKTAFGLAIAHNAAKQGKRTLVFSLEMTPNELYQRVIATRTNVDSWRLRAGMTTPAEDKRVIDDLSSAREVPMTVIRAFGFNMARIRAKVLREKAKNGVDVVMIDYIGLVKAASSRDRHIQVGDIIKDMKELALECNIPILALAQINRGPEGRTDKRPSLSDLRESGDIEQTCDAALLLFRPWYYDKQADPYEAQVIVAKHRNGPTGEAALDFDPATSTFAAKGCLPKILPPMQMKIAA